MPAIDAAMPATPTAPTEVRPASQTPANSGKTAETDSHASDAFIAALLAQSSVPSAAPEVPLAPAEGGPLLTGGQELPAMRPSLATNVTPRRATLVTDSLPAALPTGLPTDVAVVDDTQAEFATAFAALQEAMTSAAGGERGKQTEADAAATLTAVGPLADLTNAVGGAAARGAADAGQGLEALTGAHAARAQEASAPAQTYAAKPAALPMDQPALFAERLNQHVSFMIGDQVQSAQIAVSPADLGPVEVRVTMVGDEAKIQLSATHAATREALNDALPRLRASLAEAGINLGQAGVFAQMPERQQADPAFSGQPQGGERDFEPGNLAGMAPARNLRIGLIDAFV